jgi:hypothetical protein
MYSSTLPSTSALDSQSHAPAALPPGKTRYPLYRKPDGPQGRSRLVRKISPPTGIRSLDRPARSESLYRLSCPGPRVMYPRQVNTEPIQPIFPKYLPSLCLPQQIRTVLVPFCDWFIVYCQFHSLWTYPYLNLNKVSQEILLLPFRNH